MTKLDGKFHIDGERLVKSGNGEVVDLEVEPVFVFRGRDKLAMMALKYYLDLCILDDCTEFQLNGVADQIEKFKDFQKKFPEKLKQPGITNGK